MQTKLVVVVALHVKFAETSTQLHGFEECYGESFAVSNRASLKILAFAASDSIEVINQNCLSWAEWNGENADGHSLKCQLLEGFITRCKFAESSTQLSCLSNVTANLSPFQNECPLKMLAVVASVTEIVKQNSLSWPE